MKIKKIREQREFLDMTDKKRPNILWYCTDQQRSDTIKAFGNDEIHTPNLDRFAQRGVGFNQAYCQSPICTPSRSSMLTGRYPASTQVHRNGNAHFPESEKLVTRMLADAGYDCGLIGKLHIAGAEHTIEPRADDGYRLFEWSHHPRPNIKGNRYADWLRDEMGQDPEKLFEPLTAAYNVGLDRELHQTTWCTEMAIRFIDEQRSGPWMLSINPFAPHPPMFPPAQFLDLYTPSELSYPIFKESDITHQKAFRGIDQQTLDATDPRLPPADNLDTADPNIDSMGSAPPASYDAQLMKACYYAEITLVDEQFGRIIDHLEATGELENTLIVFHSDHGEMLGDHGLLYKGCRFYEGLVHVPMIVTGPGVQQDLRSDALVELVDIAPTLLDAANIEIPYYMQGTSLMPLLSGDMEIDQHKPHVFCEYHDAMAVGTVNTDGREFDASHGTMYFDGRYKLCVYHGHDLGELYDLETDPAEFHDLWDEEMYKDLKLQLLQKHLDAFAATTSAGIERVKNY